MTNKSQKIGTETETASVRAIKSRGFPHVERKRPTGRYDCGDLTGTPGICWQVKGGKKASKVSDGQVLSWLAEAEQQRANGGADVAVLIVKRAGIGDANAHRPGTWSSLTLSSRAMSTSPSWTTPSGTTRSGASPSMSPPTARSPASGTWMRPWTALHRPPSTSRTACSWPTTADLARVPRPSGQG